MCYHCFDTLVEELQGTAASSSSSKGTGGGGRVIGWRPFRHATKALTTRRRTPGFAQDLPDPAMECPLFVTWDKQQRPKGGGFPGNFMLGGGSSQQPVYELRGCIGSLSPKPLMTAIGEYALTSALRDRRFPPVAAHEISQLRVAVSLLVQYEACDHCFDWKVGTHGILIRFWSTSGGGGREYSATYLPEVADEQQWDQKTAVTSLIRKAGYAGKIDQGLLDQVDCTRYQSSKLRMTFDDYMMLRKQQQEEELTSGEGGAGTSSLPSTEPSSASSSFYHPAVDPDAQEEEKEAQQEVNHPPKQHWNTCNNL